MLAILKDKTWMLIFVPNKGFEEFQHPKLRFFKCLEMRYIWNWRVARFTFIPSNWVQHSEAQFPPLPDWGIWTEIFAILFCSKILLCKHGFCHTVWVEHLAAVTTSLALSLQLIGLKSVNLELGSSLVSTNTPPVPEAHTGKTTRLQLSKEQLRSPPSQRKEKVCHRIKCPWRGQSFWGWRVTWLRSYFWTSCRGSRGNWPPWEVPDVC